jgi:radical SAM protein with 4Fe4S-binding SPASM domain
MSCIMCWDGGNPPTEKMAPLVLDKVSSQIAPNLSVITPYEGSEPLVLSWDETREMAERHSIQLVVTTNMQFLDEEKFPELKDIAEMVVMSIDSHIPEVYEKIRPGSKPDLVFENVPRTARLCEEHGVECIAQTVFMTDNAPHLPETIAYFADSGVQVVNIIQLIDVNKRSRFLDPTLHFSAEWIEWVKQRCLAVAKRRKLRLGWWVSESPEWYDFREESRKVPVRPHKVWNDMRDNHMQLLAPGFCRYAYNRLRITVNGDVSPCGMATEGELHLGNLQEEEFPEIWNGPTARDLRRAHFTWDYPALCASCRMVARVPARAELPFLERVLTEAGRKVADVAPTLVVDAPEHMARQSDPPVIRVRRPAQPVARWTVAFALAGDAGEIVVCEVDPVEHEDLVELVIDREVWEQLATNLGQWWTVFATGPGETAPDRRAAEIRCIVRHEHMPRVPGSTLGYSDEGHVPAIYLGGERQVGWTDRQTEPPRPRVSGEGDVAYSGAVVADAETHVRRRDPAAGPLVTPRKYADLAERVRQAAAGEGYGGLVERVRRAAREALPRSSTVLVASKGDPALAELNGCAAHHFPPAGNPPDGEAALEELEAARRDGAHFLLLPDTARWWLDHYSELATHLDRLPEISPDPEACLIFDLRS